MVERLDDMPDGTMGFRGSGEMTLEDYRVILDPMEEVLEGDGELRLLFDIEGDFKAHDPRVFWADLKADYEFNVAHRDRVRRTALVTDVGWLEKWVGFAAWMAPGETKLFKPDQLDEAKSWVAA